MNDLCPMKLKDGNSSIPKSMTSRTGILHKQLGVEEQEEEQVRPPTTDGRPSRELQQILKDAKEFVGAAKEGKRIRKHLDKY